MATFIYTATHSVIATHTINTEYDLEIGLTQFDRVPVKVGTDHVSNSGYVKGWDSRIDKFVDVKTKGIEGLDNLDLWTEFLDSASFSQSFVFDPLGTAASPLNPLQVRLEGDYRPIRVGKRDIYEFAFRLRLPPVV